MTTVELLKYHQVVETRAKYIPIENLRKKYKIQINPLNEELEEPQQPK